MINVILSDLHKRAVILPLESSVWLYMLVRISHATCCCDARPETSTASHGDALTIRRSKKLKRIRVDPALVKLRDTMPMHTEKGRARVSMTSDGSIHDSMAPCSQTVQTWAGVWALSICE